MKIIAIVIAGALFPAAGPLSAAAASQPAAPKTAPSEYNPVIVNLAMMFDFMPVKGDVRELQTRIIQENRILRTDTLKMNRDGCVDEYTAVVRSGGRGNITLRRNNNRLTGVVNGREMDAKLNADCLITDAWFQFQGETQYQYTDFNLIQRHSLYNDTASIAGYTYDGQKRPVNVKVVREGKIISESKIGYYDDRTRPDDSHTDRFRGDKRVASIDFYCRYDNNKTPVECTLEKTTDPDGKAEKRMIRIVTTVSYY